MVFKVCTASLYLTSTWCDVVRKSEQPAQLENFKNWRLVGAFQLIYWQGLGWLMAERRLKSLRQTILCE